MTIRSQCSHVLQSDLSESPPVSPPKPLALLLALLGGHTFARTFPASSLRLFVPFSAQQNGAATNHEVSRLATVLFQGLSPS